MMFAQANSEHCRHKIFNADFVVDGKPQPRSLFGMIRYTARAVAQRHACRRTSDNAAVIEGSQAERFFPDPERRVYQTTTEPVHILMKVETHNHPTAISPFPGAATGAGGEIRDEGATGRGAKPKAGLVGFSVSNLRLPDAIQPWEQATTASPTASRSALEIMIEGRSAARRSTTSSAALTWPAISARFEAAPGPNGHRGARLPQADHDRGRTRQHP
jgi:phosphoribosylformylglycinamidine synthase